MSTLRAVYGSFLARVAAVFVAVCVSLGVAGAQGDKPNIVIIVADDLGWQDVSFHGGDIRTPNIDRIAGEGVELDRFYVAPVCSPGAEPAARHGGFSGPGGARHRPRLSAIGIRHGAFR